MGSRTNWAGNLTYAAKEVVTPETVAEVQQAVRDAGKLRVVGSRHCFNDIADTTGTHVSLEKMNRVLSLDTAAKAVTVEGGIRYGELGPWLHERGHALHNLASLPHISVAGACATATHGSGMHLGGLATAVTAIEFVDGSGNIVELARGRDEEFTGAIVNLGAVGVVTKMTLAVEPDFTVRQDLFLDLPVGEVEAYFTEIMSSGYSVSLFTDWQGDTIDQVWIKSRVSPNDDFATKSEFFGGRSATKNMHPLAHLDAVNCTEQMGLAGPSFDRLPHFRWGFTPASGEELQVEYFVPIEHAPRAIRALQAFGGNLAPLLMVSEVRVIAADDLWMSPFYRQPCAAFHFSCNQDWPALQKLLPALEDVLAPFSPRPHWGKVFTMAPSLVQSRYPRLPDFRELLSTYDPQGKFRNGYVERYVFGK